MRANTSSKSSEYGECERSYLRSHHSYDGDDTSITIDQHTPANIDKCEDIKARLDPRNRCARMMHSCVTLTALLTLTIVLYLSWTLGGEQTEKSSFSYWSTLSSPTAPAVGNSPSSWRATTAGVTSPRRPVPIQSHLELTKDNGKYLEAWIASGNILPGLDFAAHTRLDGLWNWVNGSDPRHHLGRDYFAQDPTRAVSPPRLESDDRPLKLSSYDPEANIVTPARVSSHSSDSDIRLQNLDARFIEHDELRYSLRSAKASLGDWLRTSHIISTDFWPAGMPENVSLNKDTETQADGVGMTTADSLQRRWEPRPKSRDFPGHDDKVIVGKSDIFHIEGGLTRYGQLPQWLDVNSPEVRIGDRARIVEEGASPALRVHHDWNCFAHLQDVEPVSQALPRAPSEEAMLEYKLQVLPTFNSMAAESGLGLNVTDLSEIFFYSNDDNFMDAPMTTSDFASPLYGPVLHINHVYPLKPEEHPEPELGEHPSLRFSAWMLGERFGPRMRYYVVHVQKAHILPLVRESRLMWGAEFGRTQAKRFRGDGRATNSHLLSYNFIIERHREALLWSYFVARLDADGDGQYSIAELQRAWRDLGLRPFMDERGISMVWQDQLITKTTVPIRDTLLKANVKANLEQAQFPAPRQSTYQFSSHDGYAFSPIAYPHSSKSQWPAFHQEPGKKLHDPARVAAWIDWSSCWPEGVGTDPVALFKHMAFVKSDCGDFLITLLINKSGRKGMSAFLPDVQTLFPTAVSSFHRNATTPHLPLNARWEDIDFSLRAVARNTGWSAQSRRDFAMRLIQRYSYVISAGSVAFEMLTGPKSAWNTFESLRKARSNTGGTALIGINDDVATSPKETFAMFRHWMEWSWPRSTAALPYEMPDA